ncbi:targeting protein for Xklp2 homolog [Diorhabda sublineata]|uniref:targeting protein for Xklp2 homolog n=1 Tax=Diorhabda sublineata TaxID=1163346 RepID=UPI0024E10AA9|nr:targeting protein for Xklp2 homolog [Diorhabda sublineata]
MAESFDDINAPQFFDFNRDIKDLDDTADGYFEQAHEDPLNNSDISNEVTFLASEVENLQFSEKPNFRKSMSVGDLQRIIGHVHKLRSGKQYVYDGENGEENDFSRENYYSEQTVNSEAGSSGICSSKSQELINRLAQPKRKFKSNQELNKNEYVPMAEALIKFQNGTPKRFRVKPVAVADNPLKATIPHSPKLKTSLRNRPLHAQSREELEQLALAEAKKSQFKAHPLNKKILRGPVDSNKSKRKTSTIPEPFKLTEVQNKVIPESPQKVQEFHARPVPKFIYNSHVMKPQLKASLTTPQTPTFIKKMSLNSISTTTENKNLPTEPVKLKPTKPIPFSFELRDKCMRSKREALVQKYIEAEKKARMFHAKPVPKSVIEPPKNGYSFSRGNSSNTARNNNEDNINSSHFKAKPPKVLYQKPFVPQLPNRPLLEIQDFALNTDMRAKEREQFEQQVKEREEKLALFRQEEEIMKKRQEEEEIIEARKLASFKAKEIRKYKEIKIQPLHKVTNPVSPKFSTNKLRNSSKNKENNA